MMKKLLTICVFLLSVVCLSAQTTVMKVTMKDGGAEMTTETGTVYKLTGVVKLPANAFKNIVFETVTQPQVDTVLTAVLSDYDEDWVEIKLNTKPKDLNVRRYGVEYNTTEQFDAGNYMNTYNDYSSNIKITNLQPSTTYYFQGYVEVRLANGSKTLKSTNTITYTTPGESMTIIIKNVEVSYNSATVTLNISGNDLSNCSYGVYCDTDRSQLGSSNSQIEGTTPLTRNGDYTITINNLQEGTQYYLMAYLTTSDDRRYLAESSFTTREMQEFVEPQIVDLGLSVKWSSFNLGAKSETGRGGLFGWGDKTGEKTERNSGYYASSVINGSIGGNPEYDIAAAKLGGHWRMPTVDELKELNSCQMIIETRNGVKGIVVKGKGSKSDNEIFIPFAGYRSGSDLFQEDLRVYLWSDSTNVPDEAIFFQNTSNYIGTLIEGSVAKYNGATVRPVWDDGSGSSEETGESGEETDPTKLAVEGTLNNPETGAIPQEAVDLGLPSGTKWARWNVGAMTPTGDKGRYYAWGATKTEDSYSLTAYNDNPYFERVAGENDFEEIEVEDDVAAKLWGGNWRMPTIGQISELTLYCTATWATEGGLEGYKFTAENGNYIFIPAGGHKVGSQAIEDGVEGSYWSSSIWDSNDARQKKELATKLYFDHDSATPQVFYSQRWQGLLIRPVQK